MKENIIDISKEEGIPCIRVQNPDNHVDIKFCNDHNCLKLFTLYKRVPELVWSRQLYNVNSTELINTLTAHGVRDILGVLVKLFK